MGFGLGAQLRRCDRRPIFHAQGATSQAGEDSGHRSVGCVRQHQPLKASRVCRRIPRSGIDREMAASRSDQEGQVRTDRGRHSSGGVISPLLLNVALYGLAEAAGDRYRNNGIHSVAGTPVLVRYADDMVAGCHSGNRPHGSRRSWPDGCKQGVWHSTRTRHGLCTSRKASTSSVSTYRWTCRGFSHHGRDSMADADPTRLVHASCHRSLRPRHRRKQPVIP